MMYIQLLYKTRYLLTMYLLLSCKPLMASNCLDLLPSSAMRSGNPHICQSDISGVNQAYSCQDYRSDKAHFRVLYLGGTKAKALLKQNQRTGLYEMVSKEQSLDCPLPPPVGIAHQARHLGLGICLDENDQQQACSIYQYAGARVSRVQQYLVFFGHDKHTQDKIIIHTRQVGRNDEAMTAELAYQLGVSLWNTQCCHSQAIRYLAYAYQLFPESTEYQRAYTQRLHLVASN